MEDNSPYWDLEALGEQLNVQMRRLLEKRKLKEEQDKNDAEDDGGWTTVTKT